MLAVADARERILAVLEPLGTEIVTLPDACGRIAAEPIVARLNQPPADVSAMDGYALSAEEGRVGRQLRIVGSAPAGHPFADRVGPGEAVRLYTGSIVPDGTDAILIQENATAVGDTLRVQADVKQGQHIRRAGKDFARGDVLVPAGRRLTARDIGLAAAGNHPWIAVYRQPRIAILATGDEVSLPGEPIVSGGVVSSNAHALAALIRSAGGIPMVLPIARDDKDAIVSAAEAAWRADLLLTTGGASVGDYDLVQPALAARGLVVDFWKIAMRPGKPLMWGQMDRMPVLGLPGNPVSALVCAILFLVPALFRLSGRQDVGLPSEAGILGVDVRANDQREDYMRARITRDDDGNAVVTPFPVQDSSMLRVMAEADALLIRPPFAPALGAGGKVSFIRLAALGL